MSTLDKKSLSRELDVTFPFTEYSTLEEIMNSPQEGQEAPIEAVFRKWNGNF